MASIAKLVAMESILEQMTGELVLDVQSGRMGVSEELMQSLEALVDATRKIQIVRENMEASAGVTAGQEESEAEEPLYRFRLAS
ncbi:MAG: hypothetical protein HQL84_13400 [Magnetococcales bacterium]|nr:hypothetical protein [Magnetococcales bacterium]MBF0151030.1 hypothetical protein [Magnetococcales bacterium]MBF0173724.1 hypothetical protein [Magnetococcales bacterium]MBF0348899.1 hypothetical protein [Magnetococcales bacterium]MBF0632611.1 hypothetical protein [Magnetococcales bacterium]